MPNRSDGKSLPEEDVWALLKEAYGSEAELEDDSSQAETTVNSVLSAWDDDETEITIRTGPAVPGGGQADGRPDELLELVTHEARLITARLARENETLKSELTVRDRRIRRLSEALADAQAALDIREARRAEWAGATPQDVPDAPREAQVLNVNAELGMVILNQGAQQGVRYGLTMTVLRERRVVARVRVVDVRATVAGAVVEETTRGDYPKTGDRVTLVRSSGS